MLSSISMALKRVSLCGITVVSDTSHSRSQSPSPLVPLPTSGAVSSANCHVIRHLQGLRGHRATQLYFSTYTFKFSFFGLV